MADEDSEKRGLHLIPEDFSLKYYDFELSSKAKERGRVYFKEGYIHKMKILKTNSNVVISARCYKSMKKSEEPHFLNVELNYDQKTILDSYCSCTAGSGGRCSHIVGLVNTIQQLKLLGMDDVPSEQPCTSLPQTWHIPRGNKIKPASTKDIIVVKAKENRKRAPIIPKGLPSTSKPLTTLSEAQVNILGAVQGAPISKLDFTHLQPITSDWGDVMLGSVLGYQGKTSTITLNQSKESKCGNTLFPLDAKVNLPPWYNCLTSQYQVPDPKAVEESTRDQYLNPDWQKYRANRITASKMHLVVKRKKMPTPAMLKSLFYSESLSTAATDYGLSREKLAKEKYVTVKSVTNSHIHECGLVINNSFPFLAATPDAKVCEGNTCGLLEIKCPYTARDMTMDEACLKVDKFLLCKEGDKLKFNKNHDYYIQIEGQLLVTGAPWCDLAVYTTKDFFIERIEPDITFSIDMLLKLAFFHRFHCVPYLTSK